MTVRTETSYFDCRVSTRNYACYDKTMEEKFSKVIELSKEATKKECYKIDLVDEEPATLDDKLGGKPYMPMSDYCFTETFCR